MPELIEPCAKGEHVANGHPISCRAFHDLVGEKRPIHKPIERMTQTTPLPSTTTKRQPSWPGE